MKSRLILLFVLLTSNFIAQNEENKEKKEVRRTIGLSTSLFYKNKSFPSFNYYQASLVYRQCWKSYIFSSQLSLMNQENAPIILINNNEYTYYTDSSVVTKNTYSSMNGIKIGGALHKGWTNERVNIYLGIGISASNRHGKANINSSSHVALIDSVSNELYFKPGLSTHFLNNGKYLTLDINLHATIEFLLFANFTATLAINPELSNYFLRNVEGESMYFKKNGTYMQYNGIQLGLHYKI